jgi:hypothetical protein
MSLYDKVKEDKPWQPLSEGTRRLYVLIRGDLTKSQQAVQGGHAVAQFCLTHPEWWQNEYLIFLKAKDHMDLVIWREKLRAKGAKIAEFKEPDIGNETTAVAAYGQDVAEMLAHLPLL